MEEDMEEDKEVLIITKTPPKKKKKYERVRKHISDPLAPISRKKTPLKP